MGSTYYQAAYGGPNLDFSGIASLGDSIGGAIDERQDTKRFRDAWERSGGDYNRMVQELYAAGDVKGAAAAAAIMDRVEGQNNRFGLQPLFDNQGNAYQPMSQGGVQKIELPGGARLQEPRIFVPTPQGVYERGKYGGGTFSQQPGTEHQVYGSPEEAEAAGVPPQPPQEPGFIPKDYITPEQQKELGDSRGKAMQAIPASKAMANRVIGAITKLEQSPNLSSAIGPIQSRLPTFRDKTADVEADIEQAIGGTFTSAYESLRGAQAITDIEGTKATAAITRLQNLKQSDPGYRQALADAKYEVFNLHNIVRQKAGLEPEENPYPPPQTGAPSAGGGMQEGRTATGPDGKKYIVRNGQLVPMQ
jgi:hypothetical protein